jgi:hypothetical protein
MTMGGQSCIAAWRSLEIESRLFYTISYTIDMSSSFLSVYCNAKSIMSV